MSPIIIFLIDFWIFLQLAKTAFFIGFLTTYQETKNGKLKRSDLLWPMLSLSIGALWLVLYYFWPTENRSAMTLIILSISSHATGSFVAINANVKTTKRSKAVTIFSMLVSACLIIFMISIMSGIKLNPKSVIDFLFFAGLGASFGSIFYQTIKIVSGKVYTTIANSLMLCAVITVTIFVALAIGQVMGYGTFIYANLILMAINLIFSGLLSYFTYELGDDFLSGDSASRYLISLGTIACLLVYLLQTLFFNF